MTTSKCICQGKIRVKKLHGYRCPFFESLSFVFLDVTAYAMAPNTHTERTKTPTSSPIAIAESTKTDNISAMTTVLNDMSLS